MNLINDLREPNQTMLSSLKSFNNKKAFYLKEALYIFHVK